MTHADFNGALGALLFHILLALGIAFAPKARPKVQPQWVQVDVRKKEPPPAPPPKVEPEPPKPLPPPPPPVVKKVKREPRPPEPPKAPVPNETPKDPPKDPPKPIFGLTDSSTTTNDSPFSVATGNTTIADPRGPRSKEPARPLPPAPPSSAPAPVFKPASAIEVKEWPVTDEASCQIPERYYPEDMREQGIEGVTQLRVQIDDRGKVVSARVLRGPNKALDGVALMWMRTHCRFQPARSTTGKPLPFEITYDFKWEINR